MMQVTIGGNVICEMDAVAQAEYEKVARWLQEAITERDTARASARLSETVASERLGEMYRLVDQRNVARAEVAALRAEVARLTICDCGKRLSMGKCATCDNDD